MMQSQKQLDVIDLSSRFFVQCKYYFLAKNKTKLSHKPNMSAAKQAVYITQTNIPLLRNPKKKKKSPIFRKTGLRKRPFPFFYSNKKTSLLFFSRHPVNCAYGKIIKRKKDFRVMVIE